MKVALVALLKIVTQFTLEKYKNGGVRYRG